MDGFSVQVGMLLSFMMLSQESNESNHPFTNNYPVISCRIPSFIDITGVDSSLALRSCLQFRSFASSKRSSTIFLTDPSFPFLTSSHMKRTSVHPPCVLDLAISGQKAIKDGEKVNHNKRG